MVTSRAIMLLKDQITLLRIHIMNRNTGSVKTFNASFARVQEGNPVNFGFTRSNTVKAKQEFVVTVKNEQASFTDAELFVQVVLQNCVKTNRNATKVRLDHEYRVVRVNQNVTRYFVTGYFE